MQDKSQPPPGKKAALPDDQVTPTATPMAHAVRPAVNAGRSQQNSQRLASPNHGRRGLAGVGAGAGGINTSPIANNGIQSANMAQFEANMHHHHRNHPSSAAKQPKKTASSSPTSSPSSSSSSPSSSSASSSPSASYSITSTSPANKMLMVAKTKQQAANGSSPNATSALKGSNDSLRYEYDDHYFLTDPDEFIYEFFPLSPEWQLIKTRPITLSEFEQLPFVRSLFFKYGLYFPQTDIRSVLHTDSSGATTIRIGMPTHMIPRLIFHYNLKYYDSDLEHYEGISLKRFVMQSVESGTSDSSNGGQVLLSNIVTFRVHLPENGAYILDIFANSTTPTQYITGEPMKFKSVCKFKIIARGLKTCMIPLPDCASGEYGPMKATRLFGLIPITHENGLISVQNEKRFLEIQFRMTRPLLDFMASLHKNGYDERQLSKSIKIFIDGDIVFVTVKFFEDGQYGLDIYTRDNQTATNFNNLPPNRNHDDLLKVHQLGSNNPSRLTAASDPPDEPKKQLLTHCCKYLVNIRTS